MSLNTAIVAAPCPRSQKLFIGDAERLICNPDPTQDLVCQCRRFLVTMQFCYRLFIARPVAGLRPSNKLTPPTDLVIDRLFLSASDQLLNRGVDRPRSTYAALNAIFTSSSLPTGSIGQRLLRHSCRTCHLAVDMIHTNNACFFSEACSAAKMP